MNNPQKILLALLLILAGTGSTAQQVYTSTHYGAPGDLYLYNRFAPGPDGPDVTTEGANVTWDLSTYTALSTHVNEISIPVDGINQFTFLSICALSGFSTLECFDIWNATDQVLQLADTLDLMGFALRNLQRYQTLNNNYLLENFLGFTVDFNGLPTSAVIVYEEPDTIIQFPASYGDAWTSSMNFQIDLTPVGQDLNYISHQSRQTSIDSWGTLMTPYDTFEHIIRLRSDILRDDTLILDGQVLPLQFTQVEYMWLDTAYSLPVMTANGILGPNDTVLINAFEYIYESVCATPTWSVSTGSNVFYLDQDGSVTIDFTVENNNADIYTWDLGDGSLLESEGSISHAFTLPGDYAVAIIGCMTHCLPLNSCSFQIVDFQILDTITSLQPVPADQLGIYFYPNPVTDHLQYRLPERFDFSHYTVFDLSGKSLIEGVIRKDGGTIQMTGLTPGVYMVRLSQPTQTSIPSAVFRFIKSDH